MKTLVPMYVTKTRKLLREVKTAVEVEDSREEYYTLRRQFTKKEKCCRYRWLAYKEWNTSIRCYVKGCNTNLNLADWTTT